MYKFSLAKSADDYAAARSLFTEYSAAININLDFQHFEEELNSLHEMYAPPWGGIILVENEEVIMGCVGIRKITATICELKRMYVRPFHQHKGIGKILLEKALVLSKEYNYHFVRLDTLNYMISAISLYKEAGFYEIAPYYHNPITTAVYFEKKL